MNVGEQGEFLHRVWQEACRHIEIEEFAATVAALLADSLPLRELAIYEKLEHEAVGTEEALEQQRGNVSAAARSVGLTRRAFEYRLERAQGEDTGERGGERGDHARTEEET